MAPRDLSVWDKIRILQEWAPAATYIQAFLGEHDPHRKAVIVSDACEWLASKSSTKVDDELVSHLTAMLKSPQGEAFLRWVILKLEAEQK